jgi:hypothetical protein
MSTQASPHRPRRPMAAWTAGPRRLAAVLVAVIAGLLASAAAATAAFAGTHPIPGGPGGYIGDPYIGIMGTGPVAPVPPATVRVIAAGGMAGWQVALIAAGAALAAAAAAVLLDRRLAGHRRATATTA